MPPASMQSRVSDIDSHLTIPPTDWYQSLTAAGLRVVLDDRDQYRPGWKFAQYEVEGVPVRLAVGPRDAENGTVEVARRDGGDKETEARIKDETKATIRCVPFPGQFDGIDTEAPGTDPVSGAPSAGRVVFARSY